jgi:serine/threonine protein kinase
MSKNINSKNIKKEKESQQKNEIIKDIRKWLELQLKFINQNIEKKISSDVISQIQEHIKTDMPFDSWNEWVVYKIPIEINRKLCYFLVAKKRFDHNTQKEYNNHKEISRIISWNHEFKKFVDVPKLYWHFDDAEKNESYIIMDYIQWKTMFTKIIEKITLKKCKNDKESIWVLKDFIEKDLWYVPPQFADIYAYLKKYMTEKNIKIFDYQEWMKIKYKLKQFLSHIHKSWFYHRDIWDNLRNIIVGDDGKIYIIDFWQSIITNNRSKLDNEDLKDIYYSHWVWNSEFYFPKDESLLNIVEKLTPIPQKKEPRELF